MMEILGDADAEQLAEALARQHHAGQTDRSGVPYIEHVEAVARSPYLSSSRHRQVAWLHDIVEDTARSRGSMTSSKTLTSPSLIWRPRGSVPTSCTRSTCSLTPQDIPVGATSPRSHRTHSRDQPNRLTTDTISPATPTWPMIKPEKDCTRNTLANGSGSTRSPPIRKGTGRRTSGT